MSLNLFIFIVEAPPQALSAGPPLAETGACIQSGARSKLKFVKRSIFSVAFLLHKTPRCV